jgi:hypothetical protein
LLVLIKLLSFISLMWRITRATKLKYSSFELAFWNSWFSSSWLDFPAEVGDCLITSSLNEHKKEGKRRMSNHSIYVFHISFATQIPVIDIKVSRHFFSTNITVADQTSTSYRVETVKYKFYKFPRISAPNFKERELSKIVCSQ